MLVNGKTVDAIFLGVSFSYAEVETFGDWLRQSNLPRVYSQKQTYSEADLTFIVEGENPSIVETKKSNLVAQFQNCEVEFDNYDFGFIGSLKSAKDKPINSMAAEVTITLEGYKASPEVRETLTGTETSFIPLGNLEADCRVSITSSTSEIVVSVQINGKEFTLSNLAANTTYVVDTIKGEIYCAADGMSCIDKFHGSFPSVIGGKTNYVSISSSWVTLDIDYRGRWI